MGIWLACAILALPWDGPELRFAARAERALPSRATNLERPRFSAELSSFVEAESTFAVLQIEIPYAELCFRKDLRGGLAAHFDIIARIRAPEREVFADLWPDSVRIASRGELWGRGQRFRRNLLFPLPPGPYTCEVTVAEPDAGQAGTLRLGTVVPQRGSAEPRSSSLLVGECGLTGPLHELRNDARIRSHFSDEERALCAYAELYDFAADGLPIAVAWALTSASAAETLAAGSESFIAREGRTPIGWPLPVPERSVGAYRLQADVAGGAQRLRLTATFSVQIAGDPPLEHFFLESLGALEYIAEESEVEELRMSAPDERAAEWQAFWRRRDPTPETEVNEAKDEFLQRFTHANAEFSAGRPGWQTDRGRIYIRHGPPEHVERYPFRSDGPPLEIWFYERLGRTFSFVDRRGLGGYELLTPE